MTLDEMAFVVAMGKLATEDRERYRELRAEAWEMVRQNHERKSPDDLERWQRNAS